MPRNALTLAPAAAFVLVAVASALTHQFGLVSLPEAPARIAAVAQAIDALPHIHEGWVGTDTTPMAPAIRLLRPERLIQRHYTSSEVGDDSPGFGIAIIFSPDARDLEGHHPPVCYPSAGWTLRAVAPVTIPCGARQLEAISYRFSRPSDGLAGTLYTSATSFFIVPGNEQPFHARMQAVEAAARDRRTAGLGAVHIMIMISGDPDDDARDRVLREAGGILANTIERIAE